MPDDGTAALQRYMDPVTAALNTALSTLAKDKPSEPVKALCNLLSAGEDTSTMPLGTFVTALASKEPTPGGGAAAAVGASVGVAAAQMAAQFTQRKTDVDSGAAAKAKELIASTGEAALLLAKADADAKAYADLQRSWKDKDMSAAEKAKIEAAALAVPVGLVEQCHAIIMKISAFLPVCNPNITSDAKVGIHQLAGAARAAYQTACVNSPPAAELARLKGLLKAIRDVEDGLLEMAATDVSDAAGAGGDVDYGAHLNIHINAAVNKTIGKMPADPFKAIQQVLFQASLDGSTPADEPVSPTAEQAAYLAKYRVQDCIDRCLLKLKKRLTSGPLEGVKFLVSDAGDFFTEESKKLKAAGGEWGDLAMTAEELAAKDKADAKAKREKEAKAEAERDAADAANLERQKAMEADGKQVKGGLHKFDASEVDAYGGEGTADDLMDAFGF